MMTSTTQSAGPRECPVCGRLVPDHAPESLCLSCLLDTGQGEDPAVKPPGPNVDLTGGVRFFGDYELLREAGRGGMGVVYEARQFGTQRLVALKLLSSGPFASADNVHRFHTEAAAAVRHAHQHGVLHRDLKPGNILLDADGRPCVADFGLARLTDDDSSLTLSHAMLGTVAYLAPEVAGGGAAQATTAADIYGVGAVLYEMLAGRPPFREATLAETVRAVQEREPVRVNQLNPSAHSRGAAAGQPSRL